ncbi:hypothetical protein [Catenuloplanes indicus]|uniref:MFS family permease n=1 Tax=Catenuloplanes indicus TaxID=137267 RepID=A0AAE3W2P9_9ACTN|nr:hypothetical protein [Catenuloplanes indicus]MDQ0368648.1 MFS family permease [Catenuloplanes indicus]
MIDSVLDRRRLLTTIGAVSLVFLAAFEFLAVTTIMPIITADLGGRDLYTLGFAATLAAGAVGMVTGGTLADRRGPARPLLAAIGLDAATGGARRGGVEDLGVGRPAERADQPSARSGDIRAFSGTTR